MKEKKNYKEGDEILFRSNQPNGHSMEMFGHWQFVSNEIEPQEFKGRVMAEFMEGVYMVDTLEPVKGYLCIVDNTDIIRQIDE